MAHPVSRQIVLLLPALRRRARRLADSQEAADDLVQEAALRLWQTFRRGPAIQKPEHYAMILLRNLARERWRQRRVTEELVEDMAQTEPEAPARLACFAVQAAIAQLPKDQHRLIQMVAAGETSPRRLAQITGLPAGTVMSRLARARKTLRREMGLAADAPVSELY